MRVGVEVGGTFTDLIATDGESVRIAKVPSTAGQPEKAVLSALEAAGIPFAAISDLVHGSTVATNAVLERKGGAVAFVTTAGFTDLLLIQRQDRPRIYDLVHSKPEAIVGRADTIGVAERILADGSVHTPLDIDGVGDELLGFLEKRPYVAVAICLLNSYANPTHELLVADLIRRRLPDLDVTCSHEVSREFREYERASTTVLSAYVQPVIRRYLNLLEGELAGKGFRGRFSIMQSNGGRLPAAVMGQNAVTALFSGPAAGVTGAIRQAGLSGHDRLITLDMGGTSTDVCLITDGKPGIAPQTMIDGLPVRTPVIDISTVGAGGGSIVWCDAGGMLRVGPQSAGADPGPACYGRNGKLPTITDAHAIRGTLPAGSLLGGHMRLDVDAARAVFKDLAATFSMSLEQIADSAIRIAEANIVRAIELISTERGLDPRDYVLVPFGGAGPLHAARIAEELNLTRIVVPNNAGVLSAFGLLTSDFKQFEMLTRRIVLDRDAPDAVRSTLAEMRERLSGRLAQLDLGRDLRFSHVLQMRYTGQAFELDVEIPDEHLPGLTLADLQRAFEDAHRAAYFHVGAAHSRKQMEIVGVQVCAVAPTGSQSALPFPPCREHPADETLLVHEGGASRCCVGLTMEALLDGVVREGPALVRDRVSTVYVPPDWSFRAEPSGNLLLERRSTRA